MDILIINFLNLYIFRNLGHLEKLKNAGGTGAKELETDITQLGKDLEELEDMRGAVHGYVLPN